MDEVDSLPDRILWKTITVESLLTSQDPDYEDGAATVGFTMEA